jgi:hypothetical protein
MPLVQDNLCIAHIISALGRGGMENFVACLAIAQKKAGHGVYVICIRGLGPTADLLREVGFLCIYHVSAPVSVPARYGG